MFDLFRSRAKAMRYLLIVLLSLVALSMVITLIPGFGSGGYRDNDQILAEVGDQAVTTRMVSEVIQGQIRNQQMAPQMAEFMVPQIVNQVVGEYATAYQARQMGFSVSDQELIDAIRLVLPQLFQGGEFAGKDVYQNFLAQNNTTIAEFERKVRQNILLEKLQRVAFDGIIVSPAEVEAEFRKRSEKARLEVVKFDPADIKKELKPDRATLEKFLAENAAQFQIPPQRNVVLLVADVNKLGEALAVTDQQLRAAYDSQRERYRSPERVRVRHILIKVDPSATDADKKKARAKAEEVLQKVKGGADFAKLAQEYSDDPGSKDKGGDLDWVQRGQTVKPFEDAAFALKAKDTSGVVESVFGFHIIQTLEKENERTKPFEEVKAELLTEFRQRQLFERMPALADEARAALVKNPAGAADLAAKLNLLYARAEKVGPEFDYPLLGKNADLDRELSTLNQGGVTPVLQTADNRLVVAAVTEVLPPRPAQFNEVESRVRQAYLDRRSRELSEERARNFEARLKANNNDFRKTVAELKVKVIDTGEFERTGQMKDVGPAAYFGEQPFTNPVGTVVGVYRVATTPYFFRITGRIPGDLSKLDAERSAIVSMIKERKLRERRELFEEGVVRQLTEAGKIKINQNAIQRLASAFRSS